MRIILVSLFPSMEKQLKRRVCEPLTESRTATGQKRSDNTSHNDWSGVVMTVQRRTPEDAEIGYNKLEVEARLGIPNICTESVHVWLIHLHFLEVDESALATCST